MLKTVFIKKIWDRASHNSFPDLLRYQDRWLIAFRESDQHNISQSKIVIIASQDGTQWSETFSYHEPGYDLRDPKLSIRPDGTLMMNMGVANLLNSQDISSRVSLSSDGIYWTKPSIVLEGEWLWRVTWHKGFGYGVSYKVIGNETETALYRTPDGTSYDRLTTFHIKGLPTEGTVRFLEDDQMMIILRRDEEITGKAELLTSKPPYRDFQSSLLNWHLGGPNFLIHEGKALVAARVLGKNPYGLFERMAVLELKGSVLHTPYYLPGVGDLGYPGLCLHDDRLYICYYASSGKTTALYFGGLEFV